MTKGKPLQQLIDEITMGSVAETLARFPQHSGDNPPQQLPTLEEEEDVACDSCLFSYVDDGDLWFCRRFPGVQPTDPWWWCGEYEPASDD